MDEKISESGTEKQELDPLLKRKILDWQKAIAAIGANGVSKHRRQKGQKGCFGGPNKNGLRKSPIKLM